MSTLLIRQYIRGRDFLIHIAAIAIGLLLALALENLAQYVHERRQLSEARRELALEVAENRRTWALNVTEAARIQQELDADLRLIQAVRSHAPVGDLKFEYSVQLYAVRDGPWQAVRQSSSLNLMPHEELQTYAWFHGILTSMMESMHAFEITLHIAAAIATSAPPELKKTKINDMFTKGGYIRADGQMIHDMYVMQVKSPQESKYPWDYYKVVKVMGGAQAFGPIAGLCSLTPK